MSNGELFDNDADSLDPAKVLAHMEGPEGHFRWEGNLKEMLDIISDRLARDTPELGERIRPLAESIIVSLSATMGGTVFYFPRGEVMRRWVRDNEIYRAWHDKGASPSDLARKYKIASQTAYAIIARQRDLHRRNGPDLFGYDDPNKTLH